MRMLGPIQTLLVALPPQAELDSKNIPVLYELKGEIKIVCHKCGYVFVHFDDGRWPVIADEALDLKHRVFECPKCRSADEQGAVPAPSPGAKTT